MNGDKPDECLAPRDVHGKAAEEASTPAETIAELHTFSRPPRYQVRAAIKERDGRRWLSLRGYMLSPNAGWLAGQQQVNFGPDEIDALADALQRAKALLS